MLSQARGNRITQYLLVLVTAITINFLLPRFMPGDPLTLLAGEDVGLMTPEQRAEVMEQAGLSKPLHLQYLSYLGDIVTGNFGYSYRQNRPIMELLLDRLPWTLLIAGTSLVISAVVGIFLGAISAWRRASLMDVSMLWSLIAVDSVPSFWLGMLLI